ncbi:transglutaminase-like putative cysteine protease [Allocatelliglobosispora scoriae]|uniref:Transglutaminase-like putative cysteine protease n=1 Tax=Allocatelliglobosispora scoriae TaxID=643052 RepID=A0A841BI36_9ACTN|nr:transglutaminase family protein [Allocatelliglobosispora scoriae]MBB5867285.1 transglutaminase-like putative cysteine protease [Allocatelliglobosispora scoriae]
MTSPATTRRSEVACALTFTVVEPAEFALALGVALRPGRTVDDELSVARDGQVLDVRVILGPDGNRRHLFSSAPGRLSISYRAAVADRRGEPERPTEWELLTALLPSRYCPADRMTGFAQRAFGGHADPEQRVRAICDYVFEHLQYTPEASGPTTDAADTLLDGRGVCRDYAHLVATLCRAVDIPARVAGVYAPGLSPMDFHAVVETAVDGVWQVRDATRLAPRSSLIRVSTGRDAADTAFATVLSGQADLDLMETMAIVLDEDLPADDHQSPVHLL